MGGQGEGLQISDLGGGLEEASQRKSGSPSLLWWFTQENHTCRVPTWHLIWWGHAISKWKQSYMIFSYHCHRSLSTGWLKGSKHTPELVWSGAANRTSAWAGTGEVKDVFKDDSFWNKSQIWVICHFTSPSASHPMGHTSTTQGAESGGLICFEQKLWSTSTSWPASGRTQDTVSSASPGPHTAEHSPGSDTCHLSTCVSVAGSNWATPEPLHILWSRKVIGPTAPNDQHYRLHTWQDSIVGCIFPQQVALCQVNIQNLEQSPHQLLVSEHISQDAPSLLHHRRHYRAHISLFPICETGHFLSTYLCWAVTVRSAQMKTNWSDMSVPGGTGWELTGGLKWYRRRGCLTVVFLQMAVAVFICTDVYKCLYTCKYKNMCRTTSIVQYMISVLGQVFTFQISRSFIRNFYRVKFTTLNHYILKWTWMV